VPDLPEMDSFRAIFLFGAGKFCEPGVAELDTALLFGDAG
jgi:hypothetical protein